MSPVKTIQMLLAIIVVIAAVSSCKKEPVNNNNNDGNNDTVVMTPYEFILPTHFPAISIPEDNKLYAERIQLGKQLFFDTRLSNDGKSCESCHKQEYGFSIPEPQHGFDKGHTSLPLINLAWNKNFMWNGRLVGTLEDVMMTELTVRFGTDIAKINAITEYRTMFKNFYGVNEITHQDMAKALAQYMRVLVSRDTKYDRYVKGQIMLSPMEEEGRRIFFTEKGDCFHCHTNLLATDNLMHNNGLDSVYAKDIDLGYFNVTGNPNDKGKFRTPNLRNVALRTHYMHDGRFTTLEQVVDFYNTGVNKVPSVDPLMTKDNRDDVFGLGLNEVEKRQLVAFLKTLTDSTMITDNAFAAP
jgi:cytochrome c peroxidase